MFLEQARPHFLAKFTAINMARKDTAAVFQRHFALYNILSNTDNNLNQKTYLIKVKTCPLKKKKEKVKRVFIYV